MVLEYLKISAARSIIARGAAGGLKNILSPLSSAVAFAALESMLQLLAHIADPATTLF